jgi:hypothetical protein
MVQDAGGEVWLVLFDCGPRVNFQEWYRQLFLAAKALESDRSLEARHETGPQNSWVKGRKESVPNSPEALSFLTSFQVGYGTVPCCGC